MVVLAFKGSREAPKARRSTMETRIITPDSVNAWKVPPCQRAIRINAKVKECAALIKEQEAIPGILTLGVVSGDPSIYICDGQHRREAFLLSGLAEALADCRLIHFDTMGDMADEFAELNASLVKMSPDDILRALEFSTPVLSLIRDNCPFIGYANIRRNTHSPILSMSAVLRMWRSSSQETPGNVGNGIGARDLAKDLTEHEAHLLIAFLQIARSAWGDDMEYARLWGNLNIVLCMWLYRRMVVDKDRRGNIRYAVLTPEQFRKGLMSLSANASYLDYLVGRQMRESDRGPAYAKVKSMMAARVQADSKSDKRVLFPQPSWGSR